MKKEKKLLLAIAVVCCFSFMCFSRIKVEAASRMKELKVNKTYSYKLNGKKKNKIKFTYSSYGNYKALNLYIDGKKKIKLKKHGIYWDVILCKISSNRTLIYIKDNSDNGYNSLMNLYEYKNGKLKRLRNLTKITRSSSNNEVDASLPLSSWARGDLESVEKNKLTVKWYETTKSTGIICVRISYEINGSKIKKIGSSYTTVNASEFNSSNKWTAKEHYNKYKGWRK